MIFPIYPQKLKRLIQRDRALILLISVIEMYVLCFAVLTVLLKYFEEYSWLTSMWQVWQTYTTVGYGDTAVVNPISQTFIMIFSFMAIALYAAMGGALIEYLIHAKERRRLGLMDNPVKNGYVIFNFPEPHLVDRFIEEVRFTEDNVGICIVDNKIDELPTIIRERKNVHFVKGSLVDKDTYKRSNVENNKVVIIFPGEPFNPDSDAGTKTIVDLVSQFVGKSSTRIVHILVKQSNEWMFKGLPSTPVLESLSILALVQESQDQYSAPIIQKLLANTKGSNPQTVVPTSTKGLTWKEFQHSALNASEKLGDYVNVFALVQNGEPATCPPLDTVITDNDLISIIANRGFDWKRFEEAMSAEGGSAGG
ncbi:two pore domain potassium channel family protein [candidate division KSB1 bacterium]|nr:two pore domain potassium channel family protein [candidate division KSB1 bacterium]